MKKLLLVAAAALGGLAFWRKDIVKSGVEKIATTAKSGVARIKNKSSDEAEGTASSDATDDASDESADDAVEPADA